MRKEKTPKMLQHQKLYLESKYFFYEMWIYSKTISIDVFVSEYYSHYLSYDFSSVCEKEWKKNGFFLSNQILPLFHSKIDFLLCKYTLSNINKNMNRNDWIQLNIMTSNGPLSKVIFLAPHFTYWKCANGSFMQNLCTISDSIKFNKIKTLRSYFWFELFRNVSIWKCSHITQLNGSE